LRLPDDAKVPYLQFQYMKNGIRKEIWYRIHKQSIQPRANALRERYTKEEDGLTRCPILWLISLGVINQITDLSPIAQA